MPDDDVTRQSPLTDSSELRPLPKVPPEKLLHVSKHKPGWLKVDSFDELMRHEKPIVDRIARTLNGGNLFLAHPIRLLRDIGVDLSDRAVKEVIGSQPGLTGLSGLPYQAIKNSEEEQNVRVHVHGLFKRQKP
jgi:hypothetical protein